MWAQRDWAALTSDTGVGDSCAATAEKGAAILAEATENLAKVLVELSAAKAGDFPFVIREKRLKLPISKRKKPAQSRDCAGFLRSN